MNFSPALLLAAMALATLPVMAQETPIPLTKPEQAAMAAFAKDMQATKDWVKQKTERSDGSEAAELIMRRELVERLTQVRTEGLPERLTKVFTNYKHAEAQHAKVCAEMPGGEASLAWLEAMRKDEQRRAAFDQAYGKRVEAQDELSAAAADYGIHRQADLFNASQIFDRWVVILTSDKSFAKAKAAAISMAAASKSVFSMNGMIYDKQGLRLPDNYEDEVLAGSYIARRHNSTTVKGEVVENHISVENSADYGIEPGHFLVVAKIAESAKEADAELARFKALAPKARSVKAELYMGCMH